jgi:hypothetical protein
LLYLGNSQRSQCAKSEGGKRDFFFGILFDLLRESLLKAEGDSRKKYEVIVIFKITENK